MTKIQSINPYNLELNAEYELFSDELINEKISIAHDTFTKWKNTTFEERRVLFHKLADLIEADMEKYAKLQTIEM
ncbi:MAG: aldehyde dehydrogenase family protein [bacterium]|nr:aldehyde dehydrogenase family protein [bacterium]MDP3380641.1 aldehyde dehydrogenase family protein [bacterium]